MNVLSPTTASTHSTRSCVVRPLSRYPPLSQYTPLLWLRHWLLYARYVLSYSTASIRHSRSRTWRSLSRYFHSRGTSTLAVLPLSQYPSPTSRHPLSCDSTTGLGAGCPLSHYCLYMRYPLLRGTSSLAVHPSFAAPPLAPLCPVCPLIQYHFYRSFTL